jgi:GPH family glycoside/pentoside/hexuronide:cation symporter
MSEIENKKKLDTVQSEEPNRKSTREVPMKLNLGYAVGEISDMIAYQGFSFLIFTFYSVVIGLSVNIVTIVYIIWSIYNAFNDPVLGALSDRTKTTRFGGGRRRPWIIAMLFPLSLCMFFLFTPPMPSIYGDILTAVYMGFIMMLFDTFYTAYSLNHTSLYPEMFLTDKARQETGMARRIIMVVGLIIAFALPGVFIGEYIGDTETTIMQYRTAGIVMGIIIFITILIHIKTGIREPSVEKIKEKQVLSFKDSLKLTFKNKKFIIFVVASTTCWYVFALLPLLMSIYVAAVLEKTDAMSTTLLLLIAFISSIPGVMIWSKIDAKVGSKTGMLIAMLFWAASFIPLLFVKDYMIALICMIFIGIGLGGAPYFIDRNISNIADEDALKTNNRREASYFGVHAVFIRLAAILVILSVNIVFNYSGWEVIDISTVTSDQVFGVQLLMSVFPAVALLIGTLFLQKFSIGKKEQAELQKMLKHN